jgi:hypothetical protein
MQIPCVYIPGPAPAVSVGNSTIPSPLWFAKGRHNMGAEIAVGILVMWGEERDGRGPCLHLPILPPSSLPPPLGYTLPAVPNRTYPEGGWVGTRS